MSLDSLAPWVVVIPVKSGVTTKSRLTAYAPVQRTDLGRAFAEDCAAAALATEVVAAVLVVTDDDAAAARLRGLGCGVVPDLPQDGLNAAVRHGADSARSRWPGCRVAVLPSDLPALRSADLMEALVAAAQHPRAFLSDAPGRGTNLLTAAPGVDLDPRFEGRSCDAHLASGAVQLSLSCPSIRTDVDHGANLYDARALGVGPATLAVLARIAESRSLR